MKTKYLLIGAFALVLVGLWGCQREINPNYDPETNSVLTQFVLNFNTKSYQTQTKQSVSETQAEISSSSPFRGIKEAYLMAVIQAEGMRGKVLPSDMDAERVFPMEDILSSGSISNTNSRRVLEMSLPLKTNTMLFYGRAVKPSSTSNTDEYSVDDRYGKLDVYHITATSNSANFRLGVRLQEADYGYIAAMEKLLAGILTLTMNFKLSPTAIVGTGYPDGSQVTYRYDVAVGDYNGDIAWSSYCNVTNSPFDGLPLSELERKLGTVYSQMTTIHADAGELRAASGPAILRIMQDVWTIVNSVRCADPTSKRETVAKYFAEQVDIMLQTFFSTSAHDGIGSPVTISAYKAIGSVKTAFDTYSALYWPSTDSNNPAVAYKPTDDELTSLVTKNYNLGVFPSMFNLPRGATHVRFDTTNQYFYYPSEFNTNAVGGTPAAGSGFNEKSYYFPAEILYYGNSPIRVSDNTHSTTQYPNGANNTAANPSENNPGGWNLDANWTSTDWNDNYVKSSTRSVAMQYDINYGVALLKTQVGYAANILNNQLEDNNHYVQKTLNPGLTSTDEPNNKIPITNDLFDLVGVIIGGQHQNVDWQYLPCIEPNSNPAKDVTGFVYDKAIPASAKDIPASGVSEPNYTLLFDNYDFNKDATHQDKVYIALEFLNNGPDFYGNFNLIRSGGYFYLIGELDPYKQGLTAISWPGHTTGVSEALIPPYNDNGTSKEIKRVFIQDFLTHATFKIGQYSLQYAYLTVPDLRASSVSLGLSVDLAWETGLVFPDVVLGGNSDLGPSADNPSNNP